MNGSIGSPAEQTRRSSEQRLLAILQNLVNELRDGGGGVRMDSHLDRDLGLDSLARVELLPRLERQFGASLPAGVLVEAETPHDLLMAFGAAAGLAVDNEAWQPMPLAAVQSHGTPAAAAARPDKDVSVSRLPLYHDMGLIGACLGSLYYGMPLVLMSPLTFLARPTRWLRAIHRHRATLSAGPNFAYDLCATKIADEELAGLDLSSWRVAFNGAEQVSAETLRRFASRYAAYGFRAEALAPVYGLAESSVGLAFPPLNRGPLIDSIDREKLMHGGIASPSAAPALTINIVGCGRALPGHAIRVVDARGRVCEDRHEGRVQFRGPSSCRGYFRNPEATARLIQGEWLDSGDRGYLVV